MEYWKRNLLKKNIKLCKQYNIAGIYTAFQLNPFSFVTSGTAIRINLGKTI